MDLITFAEEILPEKLSAVSPTQYLKLLFFNLKKSNFCFMFVC